MPSFPADPRKFHWGSPNGRSNGRFIPKGQIKWHGPRLNPTLWDAAETWAARMFVGLSIGRDKAWSENDVVQIVKAVREKQVGSPDSSFIMQRGLYTQTVDGENVVVDETSVQVIIINLPQWSVPSDAFIEQMVALAEKLAQDLRQMEVIVEIQKNGMTQTTIGVGP